MQLKDCFSAERSLHNMRAAKCGPPGGRRIMHASVGVGVGVGVGVWSQIKHKDGCLQNNTTGSCIT